MTDASVAVGIVGHGEEAQRDMPGARRGVVGGVPVLPAKGEVLLEEREEFLPGQVETAAARLGPAAGVIWFITAESVALTLIGLLLSAAVAILVLGGVYIALAGKAPIAAPWPLVAAILAACVLIAALTTSLPAWLQFRPRHRPAGSG
jgi:hypothetical protein